MNRLRTVVICGLAVLKPPYVGVEFTTALAIGSCRCRGQIDCSERDPPEYFDSRLMSAGARGRLHRMLLAIILLAPALPTFGQHGRRKNGRYPVAGDAAANARPAAGALMVNLCCASFLARRSDHHASH